MPPTFKPNKNRWFFFSLQTTWKIIEVMLWTKKKYNRKTTEKCAKSVIVYPLFENWKCLKLLPMCVCLVWLIFVMVLLVHLVTWMNECWKTTQTHICWRYGKKVRSRKRIKRKEKSSQMDEKRQSIKMNWPNSSLVWATNQRLLYFHWSNFVAV